VREDTRASESGEAAPARQGGGYLTGLLALLLAAAVFGFLAQFSANRQLRAENQALAGELAAAQAELQTSRAQMAEAREAVGGLRDVLLRIESLLAPPSAAGAAPGPEGVPGEVAAPPAD
jgi:type VI protein secretion system component VasK